MPNNPDLAALSEAATQGEWKAIFYDAGDRDFYDHNGPTPGIFSDEADCGIVHWDGFKQKHWTSANGNQRQIEANATFITALVNEYRAGNLVQIDEGMRERVARAIDHELVWSVETDVLASSLTREEQLKVADAAIAAMGGAK